METTIKARQMAEGTVFVTRAGHRRTVVAIDETRTHVYADFADGGSGIWALDADVTVEGPIVPWQAGDDTFSAVRPVTPSPAPAPMSSQAGLASIRGGIVATAPGHFPNCQGCNGECGV